MGGDVAQKTSPSILKREQEMLMEGCRYEEIAKECGISLRTVKAHFAELFRRYGIESGIKQVKLAVLLYREKLREEDNEKLRFVLSHADDVGGIVFTRPIASRSPKRSVVHARGDGRDANKLQLQNGVGFGRPIRCDWVASYV
jgi:hypothetical protein